MSDFNVAVSEAASKATYGGVGAGVLAALAQVDWAAWVGIGIGVIGLIINLYFKMREDRRSEEWHQLKKKMSGKQDE